MLFPTAEFLFVYLPITLAAFFFIAKLAGPRLAAAWLVLASLFFYGSWRPVHVLLLLASIAFNYAAGGLLLRAKGSGNPLSAKRVLFFVVATNLVALAYFKYTDFLISTVNNLTGLQLPLWGVTLPIGISFFTFTQIAYLADVYAGKAAERSPVRYALFVTYFPHLVAGPVLHHAQMMPQFRESRVYSPDVGNFSIGMAFLVIGLIKKVLVADSFAPIANEVFAAVGTGALPTETAWRGVLAYTLQIYFDFSGYSDMAVGLSMMIGVRLPYNFNSPYKSHNIIDFWRRWHITLSAFLRDYLYIALGGNRRGKARRYLNLMLTMLLGGLWHGASWTFVIWGGLHGFYLIVNHWWRWLISRVRDPDAPRSFGSRFVGGVVSNVITMLCVVVAWVFFRAESLDSALSMLSSMFARSEAAPTAAAGEYAVQWIWIAVFLLVARMLPNSQELIDGYGTRLLARAAPLMARPVMSLAIGASIVFAAMMALISESRSVTEFIYFNF
jgi:alginate O-acetyltransferase complex protein AlgI